VASQGPCLFPFAGSWICNDILVFAFADFCPGDLKRLSKAIIADSSRFERLRAIRILSQGFPEGQPILFLFNIVVSVELRYFISVSRPGDISKVDAGQFQVRCDCQRDPIERTEMHKVFLAA